HALAARAGGAFCERFRAFGGCGDARHRVRAVGEAAAGGFDRADPAGDAEGDVQQAGDVAHPAVVEGAALGAGGDVVEDQLVGPGVAVAGGQIGGVAHVDVALEPDALDHPAVLDVETGDDAAGGHAASACSRVKRPS